MYSFNPLLIAERKISARPATHYGMKWAGKDPSDYIFKLVQRKYAFVSRIREVFCLGQPQLWPSDVSGLQMRPSGDLASLYWTQPT